MKEILFLGQVAYGDEGTSSYVWTLGPLKVTVSLVGAEWQGLLETGSQFLSSTRSTPQEAASELEGMVLHAIDFY